MAKMDLTPEEMELITSKREEEAATRAELPTDEVLEEIIDKAAAEAAAEQETLSERVSKIESMFGHILLIKQELDSMFQKFLEKKEEDVEANAKRSKENLQILKEVHELRVHIDKLKPKIGIMFWGMSVAVGLSASYILPEIAPFLEKLFGVANAVKG